MSSASHVYQKKKKIIKRNKKVVIKCIYCVEDDIERKYQNKIKDTNKKTYEIELITTKKEERMKHSKPGKTYMRLKTTSCEEGRENAMCILDICIWN